MMKRQFAFLTALLFAWTPICVLASPGGGARVSGQVTFSGSVGKLKPYDLSKEPVCAKLHATEPLYPDSLLTGPGNSLRNVVVYISAGAPPSGAVPPNPAVFRSTRLPLHHACTGIPRRPGSAHLQQRSAVPQHSSPRQGQSRVEQNPARRHAAVFLRVRKSGIYFREVQHPSVDARLLRRPEHRLLCHHRGRWSFRTSRTPSRPLHCHRLA